MDSASLESTEVCFEESVWCMPLVIGLADAGKFDRVFAVLLVFLNLGMQTAFSWVLLSDSFMGAAFDSNIDHAKKWRTSVAHDYKFIDLADTSLVSRVCSGDGALILSTTQANLINHINSFLGLKDGSLQAPFFRPGVLLCTVCIILWTLCVYKEFRSIWLQMEAAMTIPKRSTTKVRNHTFLSMSYGRFLLLLTTYIARTAIATVLLVAGVLWLARTTSIEELMLNAVALNAILDVDEFLFAGMLPLRYQHAIRRLDPIKVSYSHGRSQAESFLHFLSLGSLVLASYFLLIGPLSETMLTVIREMCGGTQNFAVSYNSNTQRPYGLMTEIPGTARNLTHTELAVESHKATSPETLAGGCQVKPLLLETFTVDQRFLHKRR
ncbi:unnamed protein product [Symbiodinium natans]|uniref:Uncharacterized protein n=1 Tax=Symbiodinium natans TaxID=878477 RepID=A0A812P458_9DINO|nr:unnamed protein product [Symbiodinium natans]